jgi:uncharacterized lipoprotein YddW (UPF0748 family)
MTTVRLAVRVGALCEILSAAAMVSAQAPSPAVGPTEVRALWVTRNALASPGAITQMVRAAQDGGFNTLLVQVRGRGDAYYRSSFEPRAAELVGRPEFDPLAETLGQAHRAGLRVHAWVAVNLVSSATELPSSRQHVVYRQPDWLMVPRELAAEMMTIDPKSPEYVGRLARWTRARSTDVEGLYVSPLHPWAATHLVSVVREIVTNYTVDGVHLDYVRFPGEDFDYSRSALQQFKVALRSEISEDERRRVEAKEALDPLAYPNAFADRWRTFRQSRLTTLVMRVRTALKAVRPSILLSAAVVPDVSEASRDRLQDWRTWIDQSLIDALCPMAYTEDLAVFEAQIAASRELAGDVAVWAGVGAYRLTPEATLAHIAAARRRQAQGVILFSYDALVAPPLSPASLTTLGRAAFGAQSPIPNP